MLNRSRSRRHAQSGVLLLEVLIALLIFALGVLGLVGLQANAVKQAGQAKYRADATLLANELIGQMWLSSRTTLGTDFTSSGAGGTQYNAWKARVVAALPGASEAPPLVAVAQVQSLPSIVGGVSVAPTAASPTTTRVTITMRWKAPGEPSGDPPHSFVLVNQIN